MSRVGLFFSLFMLLGGLDAAFADDLTRTQFTLPTTQPVVDYRKFRDPFKELAVSEIGDFRSELERFAVTDFKVTGIITGPVRMRAMLVSPDSKTHYVSEKMKIGLRDGIITKITTKSVIVREKVVNPLGEVEMFETEIGIDQPAAGTGPSHQ